MYFIIFYNYILRIQLLYAMLETFKMLELSLIDENKKNEEL